MNRVAKGEGGVEMLGIKQTQLSPSENQTHGGSPQRVMQIGRVYVGIPRLREMVGYDKDVGRVPQNGNANVDQLCFGSESRRAKVGSLERTTSMEGRMWTKGGQYRNIFPSPSILFSSSPLLS